MSRLRYETKAGTISRADLFAQLIEHLRLASEASYMMSHVNKADDDDEAAEQFMKVGQMLERTCQLVTQLATQSYN